jgi:hypothetical protein
MVSGWHPSPERADELLDGWAREAVGRGIAPDDRGYWSLAEAWMRDRAAGGSPGYRLGHE